MTAPEVDVALLAKTSAEVVFRRAEGLASRLAVDDDQSALIAAALQGLRADAAEPFAGALHFPLCVYAGLRGAYEPAVDLAAVLVLLNLGIHLLDDLGDGDLTPHLARHRPYEIVLVATAFAGVLPQLLLTQLDATAETIVRLKRTLGEGLLRVAAGQQADLRLCGSPSATVEEVEAAVAAKSGQRRVMYARLGGQLAGATDEAIAPYEQLGLAMGVVAQLLSDCADLFGPASDSTDLANGTRTLPIVLRLNQLTGQERADFLERLTRARLDPAVRNAVRQELRAAGVPLVMAFRVEVYRQRAARWLEAARPCEPGRSMLAAMLAALAVFGPEPAALGRP